MTLAIAGCATPVPRALPPEMVPESFVGPNTTSSEPWPEVTWWEGFGDTQLSALVTDALANNRDMEIAIARVQQAEAQSGLQRSVLFPQLTAQARHVRGSCRGEGCIEFSNDRRFGLDLAASFDPDPWGLSRNNLRAAHELVRSARFGQQALALTIAADTIDLYLAVLAIRARIAIANENIAAISSIAEVIQLRVDTGTISRLDLARQLAQLEGVKARLPLLQIQEQQALFTLAVLLGVPPETIEVSAQNLDHILAAPVSAGLPSELLLRRPDIAQAEADLASAHANVDAARAAFLPQFSLTGRGGRASSTIDTLLRGARSGYSYGLDLLQTIFDGGRLRGQKRLAEATQREFIARYQAAVLNAYADVESALVAVDGTSAAEQNLRRQIDAAREAFQITDLQYRQGATDLLNVIQAQQTLFSAQDQFVQTTLDNRRAMVRLHTALGGGWLQDPADRTQPPP